MTKESLGQRLVETAVLYGDFTLKSGKKSNMYFDKFLFQTDPTLLDWIAFYFEDVLLKPFKPNFLAGTELGAVPLVTAVSLVSNIPFVIVRTDKKEHGIAKWVEGKSVAKESIIILEDVVTTGLTVVQSAKRLVDAGGIPIGVLSVVDREQGGKEVIEGAGLKYDSLFTASELGIKI